MWTLALIPPADGGEMMPPPASTQGTVGTAADGSQRSSGGGSTFSRSKGPWYLAAGEYNVGRKKESHIHVNSKSVSRQHALFTVRPLAREEVEAVGSLQTVEVQDLGSSTGTFLNDEANRLEPLTPRVLKAGDVIRVGGARLRLRHQPIVLCPSNLNKAVKETVKEAAAKAGVNLSNKWTGNCTHLVVDKEANATMKVCLAIVQVRYV